MKVSSLINILTKKIFTLWVLVSLILVATLIIQVPNTPIGSVNATEAGGSGTGSTIYVNSNAANSNEEGTYDDPYLTIQDGVDNADSTDIILVDDGDYQLTSVLEIDDDDLVLTAGDWKTGDTDELGITTISGSIPTLVHIKEDHITFEGFKIQSATYGIKIENSNDDAHYVKITDCTFSSHTRSIWIDDAWGCEISENSFSGSQYGLYLDEGKYTEVYKNTFSSCTKAGLYMYETDSCCGNDAISYNTFEDGSENGIVVTESSDNNEIKNNLFEDNTYYGVRIDGDAYGEDQPTKSSGNGVTENDFIGNYDPDDESPYQGYDNNAHNDNVWDANYWSDWEENYGYVDPPNQANSKYYVSGNEPYNHDDDPQSSAYGDTGSGA